MLTVCAKVKPVILCKLSPRMLGHQEETQARKRAGFLWLLEEWPLGRWDGWPNLKSKRYKVTGSRWLPCKVADMPNHTSVVKAMERGIKPQVFMDDREVSHELSRLSDILFPLKFTLHTDGYHYSSVRICTGFGMYIQVNIPANH